MSDSLNSTLNTEQVAQLEHMLGSMKSFLYEYFQKLGPDPIQNIQQIVKTLGKVFGSAAALYNRLEDNGLLKTWAIDLPPPGFQYEDQPEGHVCYMMTIKERSPSNLAPVEIEDLDTTPFKEIDINVKTYNLKSYLAFPVALNNHVVGSLCIVFGNQRGFSSIEKDILEAFAKAVALEEERKYAIETIQKQLKVIAELKDKAEYEKEQAITAHNVAEREKARSEKLLLNILPSHVAEELKSTGKAQPVLFKSASVMFTDFKGFTQISEKMSPPELLQELNNCFSAFDHIIEKFNLEKLKTIGDSYMCAGGIPVPNRSHALDCALAALEIQKFMENLQDERRKSNLPAWSLRLGIHSGSLVAGVIGHKKFSYDIWGDTVNTASRMESSGEVGEINISGDTYDLIKDFFDCQYRGKISAKNKGEIDMYYLKGLKPNYQEADCATRANANFWLHYHNLKN